MTMWKKAIVIIIDPSIKLISSIIFIYTMISHIKIINTDF